MRLWGVEFPSPIFKYGMPDVQVQSDVDEYGYKISPDVVSVV
jgi:hypothetical protein